MLLIDPDTKDMLKSGSVIVRAKARLGAKRIQVFSFSLRASSPLRSACSALTAS
jgi:hypothetical protein